MSALTDWLTTERDRQYRLAQAINIEQVASAERTIHEHRADVFQQVLNWLAKQETDAMSDLVPRKLTALEIERLPMAGADTHEDMWGCPELVKNAAARLAFLESLLVDVLNSDVFQAVKRFETKQRGTFVTEYRCAMCGQRFERLKADREHPENGCLYVRLLRAAQTGEGGR